MGEGKAVKRFFLPIYDPPPHTSLKLTRVKIQHFMLWNLIRGTLRKGSPTIPIIPQVRLKILTVGPPRMPPPPLTSPARQRNKMQKSRSHYFGQKGIIAVNVLLLGAKLDLSWWHYCY